MQQVHCSHVRKGLYRLSCDAVEVGFALLGKEALAGLEVCRQVGAVFQEPLRGWIDGWRKRAICLILC